jgi:hypothetical protein
MVQDSATFCFDKPRNLFHLLGVYAHFIQRFAKVLQKPIEMPVVQPLLPRMRMGSSDILACIDDSTPEDHGDKHVLPSAQLRHIGTFEKGAEGVIREDSPIEGLGGSQDGLLPTDDVIEVVDHLIPLNRKNGVDSVSKDQAREWCSL